MVHLISCLPIIFVPIGTQYRTRSSFLSSGRRRMAGDKLLWKVLPAAHETEEGLERTDNNNNTDNIRLKERLKREQKSAELYRIKLVAYSNRMETETCSVAVYWRELFRTLWVVGWSIGRSLLWSLSVFRWVSTSCNMDVDEALGLLGKWGRWQVVYYVMLCVAVMFPASWHMLAIVYVGKCLIC